MSESMEIGPYSPISGPVSAEDQTLTGQNMRLISLLVSVMLASDLAGQGSVPHQPAMVDTSTVLLMLEDSQRQHTVVASSAAHDEDGSRADWAMVWISVGMLGIAGLQAGFFLWQLRAMNESVADTKLAAQASRDSAAAAKASVALAEHTARRQLRAYLALERINSGTGSLGHGNLLPCFMYELQIRNTGQSPAHHVSVTCDVVTVDELMVVTNRPPRVAERVDQTLPAGTIGAGLKTSVFAHSAPALLRYQELLMGPAAELKVRIEGVVQYEDIFGDQWETHFARRLVYSAQRGGWDFIPLEKGNHAT